MLAFPPSLCSRVVALRAATPEDLDFLYQVYASTRTEELAPLPWSAVQKASFLSMQFQAQHSHYQQHFPQAAFDLILREGQPIGRLYLDRRHDEMRVIDIALLPEQRGQGIGSALVGAVLDEARGAGLAVRLHVEHSNPALRLYMRLGFRTISDTGIYLLMEWSA